MNDSKAVGAISFEVKTVDDSENADGEFEAILSMPTLDRDGEIIDAKAFLPLPESIPIHKFHQFDEPIAKAFPYYDGDVLKAKGVFDPDEDSQKFRPKVGRSVGFMSVGFMNTEYDKQDPRRIVKAELLEASFVSVPSNREAAILAVKQYEAKAGARNSTKDSERLQQIHDLAVTNGALCAIDDSEKSATTKPESEAAESTAKAAETTATDDSTGADSKTVWTDLIRFQAEQLLNN